MTAFLIALCILLVILPPKYDPAIRLKEWLNGDRRRKPTTLGIHELGGSIDEIPLHPVVQEAISKADEAVSALDDFRKHYPDLADAVDEHFGAPYPWRARSKGFAVGEVDLGDPVAKVLGKSFVQDKTEALERLVRDEMSGALRFYRESATPETILDIHGDGTVSIAKYGANQSFVPFRDPGCKLDGFETTAHYHGTRAVEEALRSREMTIFHTMTIGDEVDQFAAAWREATLKHPFRFSDRLGPNALAVLGVDRAAGEPPKPLFRGPIEGIKGQFAFSRDGKYLGTFNADGSIKPDAPTVDLEPCRGDDE